MSGALRAGSVYVAVSASIGEFTKTMGQMVKAVENTAKRVKEAAKGIADVGAVFAAAMGGAVLASAQSNRAIQGDLENLKGYLTTMAADLGDAFGPFLRELTATVGAVAGAFQRLSPEVKAAVAQFLVMGAGVGAGAMVLGKAAGLVEGVAKAAGLVLGPALSTAAAAAKALGAASASAFPSLGKAVAGMEGGVVKSLARVALSFGAVLAPVAAVVAAVGAVALVAGLVYKAWNDSSTGVRDSVLLTWEAIKGLGASLMETMGGWFDTLKAGLMKALSAILDGAAFVLRKIGGLMAPLAKGLGLDGLAGMYQEMSNLTGEQLLKDLKGGAAFLADNATKAAGAIVSAAETAGSKIATGVRYGVSGLKDIAKDMGAPAWIQDLKATLGGVLGGPAANTRKPTKKGEESEKKKLMKELAKGADQLNRDYAAETHEEFIASVRAEEAAGAAMFKQLAADAARMADEAQGLAQAAAARARAAKDALAEKFSSAFGDLSALVDTFQTGLAAGGPAAALVAVLGELLTHSTQFATLVETLNGLIGMVADWLGKLAEPFIPLVGAISTLIDAGLQVLTPVLSSLTAFIQPMVPSIMVLGELFQGLAPAVALMVQAMMLIHNPMQLLAGPALKALFAVLKVVSAGILTVAQGISSLWNGIISAVQSVFRSLADIKVFGAKPLSFLDGWASGLESAKVDTDAMARALQALAGMTYEAAQEKAKETAEVIRNRQATEKATQALTNVPSAFKYALAAFDAQDPQGSGAGPAHGSSAPSVPVPTVPPPQGSSWDSGRNSPWGGTGTTAQGQTPGGVSAGGTIMNINIQTTSLEDAAVRLERVMDKQRYLRTGSRGQSGRYAVGDTP